VFNSPSLIHERGRVFEEQIAPGAFAKTINARDRIVMQFDHGQHPLFGSLPLGKITALREDSHGLYVEARLTDNWLTAPIRDAIANEAITGMSFRFSVPDGGDTWDRSGQTHKRTVHEVRLYELGPVVHPAYEDTTVGVRSVLNLLTPEQRAQVAADLAPTPDDGQVQQPDEANATPDEGQRRRSRSQRQALVRLRLTA
jgi:HK97 family phage prohead protease